MNKKIKFIILLFYIIIAIIVVKIIGFDLMKARDFIKSFGVFAPLVFILIYAISIIFFLPASPLSISSGVLFGNFYGVVYDVIGATIGASVAFFIAKKLGKDYVDDITDKKIKLKDYNKKIEENGLKTTLFFRLIPLFPFNALNYSLGLTKLRFKHYFIGTFFGIIPGSFIYVNLGNGLATKNYYGIIFSILLFLALASAPFIYKKYKKSKEYKK